MHASNQGAISITAAYAKQQEKLESGEDETLTLLDFAMMDEPGCNLR